MRFPRRISAAKQQFPLILRAIHRRFLRNDDEISVSLEICGKISIKWLKNIVRYYRMIEVRISESDMKRG